MKCRFKNRMSQPTPTSSNEPWWLFWLLLALGIALAMVIKLALRRLATPVAPAAAAPPQPQAVPRSVSVPPRASTVSAAVSAPVNVSPPAPPAADDLTRIEGIGPKISSWLNEAGITTFAQVAALTPDQLAEILRNAGHRIAVTDTWPEQAAFAAAGQWDELAQFQDTLHGGRRK